MADLETHETISVQTPLESLNDSLNLWVDYWNQNDFWNSTPLWKINAAIFYLNLKKIIPLQPNEPVLSIGCGPGYFEKLLAKDVERIVACDVSENFIRIAKELCQKKTNVEFRLLGEDYTHLESFEGPYSLILCNGVIQYYKDTSEILNLVRSAQKIVCHGSRMLISDLPMKRSLGGRILDWMQALLLSIPGRYFLEFIQVSYAWLIHGAIYRMYERAQRSMKFSATELQELAKSIQEMGLKVSIVKQPVSCFANRPSLLIYF